MRSEALKRAQRKYWKSEKHRTVNSKNNARSEALRRGATIGDLTDMAKIYKRCEWWRQWFDVTVDHIIPFSKGGAHEASNLQIIYQSENRRKFSKLNYKPQIIFI